MNDTPVTSIVIVGGGSAGWLTAGILAAEHNANRPGGMKITLIESPQVNTIGVGEGTWPTMRSTLQTIGISETEFFRCCDASFKQGSKFVGWRTGRDDESYYHPFEIPNGLGKANLFSHWHKHAEQISFAGAVCPQPHLCDRNLAPKQPATPEYAAVANYAYHLDAGKFADLLKGHCVEKLGVTHILAHVTDVKAKEGDFIESVCTEQGEIKGDLFIDCSGLKSLLLGQHYQIPFVDKRDILFNDKAVALQVPYVDENAPITSHTVSTARAAGWIWDIGLPTRCGVGYTYSSAHTDDDTAMDVVMDYARAKNPNLGNLEARMISFRPGHRQKFWHKNAVAVGMAAGFLEPLEASALALVELSAKMISKELPAQMGIMELAAKRFNRRFDYRWQRIIEFLKLHYVLSQRSDSDYWKDNRKAQGIPQRLAELLTLWRYQSPTYNDFTEIEEIFPSASYQYVLYGMGFVTQNRPVARRDDSYENAVTYFNQNTERTEKYLRGLPSNRELINHIIKCGMTVQ